MPDETTPRHALPLLASGQAQKELTHNEALARLDLLAHPAVETAPLDIPPATPAVGQTWIIGDSPAGEWTGRAGALALWTINGWRFAAAMEGMRVWVKDGALWAERDAVGWTVGIERCAQVRIGGRQVLGEQQGAIGDPAGGANQDVEARVALSAVLNALRSHGLIAQE